MPLDDWFLLECDLALGACRAAPWSGMRQPRECAATWRSKRNRPGIARHLGTLKPVLRRSPAYCQRVRGRWWHHISRPNCAAHGPPRCGVRCPGLFLFSIVLGAGILLAADTVTQVISQPVTLTVGAALALLGVPFFLYLVWRRSS
jgi:FecCD transport family